MRNGMSETTGIGSDQDHLKLVEGLRKALDGDTHILHGTEKPGVKPLFTKPAGKILAQRAVAEGYVEPVVTTPAKKSKAAALPAQVRLTDKGRQFILDADSPKKVLEELLAAVKRLEGEMKSGTNERTPSSAAPADQVRRVVESELGKVQEAIVQKTVKAALDKLQQAIEASVARTLGTIKDEVLQTIEKQKPSGPTPPERLAGVLQVVEKTIEKAHRQPITSSQPSVDRLAPGPVSMPWLDEVVAMATRQKQQHPLQALTFPQVYGPLKQRYPNLTLAQFHDGLRLLSDQRRIRLRPYTLALESMEDPRNALYLDREVKYYVDVP